MTTSPPPPQPDDLESLLANAVGSHRNSAAGKPEDSGSSTLNASPNISPQLRREIALNFIAACTDVELQQIIAESRPNLADVRAVIHREMHRQHMALNDDDTIRRTALGH